MRAKALPRTGWTRVDVASLWPTRLLPLVEASPFLQGVYETCLGNWIVESVHQKWRPAKPWLWSDSEAAGPHSFGRGDAWVTNIERRIEEAAEADDPYAIAHNNLTMLRCVLDEIGVELSGSTADELSKIESELYSRYEPRRSQLRYWIPNGSCHWLAPFALELAKAWCPSGDWLIVASRWHSTVVDLKGMRVFDIMLFGDEDDTDPDEPINFVRGVGLHAREIRKVDRLNKVAHERYDATLAAGKAD